jgi:hypothetical protein
MELEVRRRANREMIEQAQYADYNKVYSTRGKSSPLLIRVDGGDFSEGVSFLQILENGKISVISLHPATTLVEWGTAKLSLSENPDEIVEPEMYS